MALPNRFLFSDFHPDLLDLVLELVVVGFHFCDGCSLLAGAFFFVLCGLGESLPAVVDVVDCIPGLLGECIAAFSC
jgi:hypothetical protein